MNPMQSPNTGVGKALSGENQHGILTKGWEAYKRDSQECVFARTKGLARRFAIQNFGEFDLLEKAQCYLSKEEHEAVMNDGFVR